MMASIQNKRKTAESDSDTTSSISSFINLGDVGNTMNEDSNSEGKYILRKNVSRSRKLDTKISIKLQTQMIQIAK